jgi:nuclear pore complex protein Nup214
MILVASANCIDVNFLRISKTGDVPEWTQEFPNDAFPAELPLAADKSETFPIGFELDTASTNRLNSDEGFYPVMPIIHILSTHGCLCSFYILNTTTTFVDICSPPRPLDPSSLSLFKVPEIKANEDFKTPPKAAVAPMSHSTPALPKLNLFGSPASASAFSNNPTTLGGFSMPFSSKPQPQQQPLQLSQPLIQQQPATSVQFSAKPANIPQTVTENVQSQQTSKPLITVPAIYNPPLTQEKLESREIKSVAEKQPNESEDESVYNKMIQDEIKAFELEYRIVMEKSKSVRVHIGTKEESAEMRKNLEELDELKKEATETIDSLKSEVWDCMSYFPFFMKQRQNAKMPKKK